MQQSYTQLKLLFPNENAVTDVLKQSIIVVRYGVS